MTRIATVVAAATAAIAAATSPLAAEINLTKTYTRVHIQVWSETVNQQAVATNWCQAKGHGHAVDIIYVGLRHVPGNLSGGMAYYQKIACLTVPLRT